MTDGDTREMRQRSRMTMSDDFTVGEHSKGLAESAKMIIGWVLRTFKTRKARPVMTLFTSLILSWHHHIGPEKLLALNISKGPLPFTSIW